MGLRTKFNLVMITAFLIGLAAATFLAREITTEEAKRQMLSEATLLMRSGTAVRSYTQNEIRPLILDQLSVRFLPHSVPSWSAQTVLHLVHKDFPDYSYKEAALNPTNPSDRATTWEADIINEFKRNGDLNEFVATRDTPTGQFLTFARPFRLTDRACLACHSTPAAAPATMVDLYGNSNGFGWVLNDVIGAQIVSVPMSVALARANKSLLAFVAALSAVFVGMLIILNVLMHFFILRPMQEITTLARDVSAGKPDVPEYKVKGRDEIASLGRSFNLMHRSLQNAIRMLEGV
ncbi:c-type heme family protein [Reyranella sp.]|jgi:protein-histidine pros-kinase|uniref:c-type heme family protein n=1 Tax=Reyranella sp. TaxID=1929291 RepID=UPI002F958BAE